MALGAVAAVLALALVAAVVLTRGDDDPTVDPGTESAGTSGVAAELGEERAGSDPNESEPAPPDLPATTLDPASTPVDPASFSNRPDDYEPRLADSWLTATPCPEDQPRVACIVPGVGVTEETGELNLFFFTEGFVPELEPAGYHVHFYFDTSVDGDEDRAGSASPGGEYRLWDQPFAVTSTNGENGRAMYTIDDAEAADARYLCAIVADADQVAIADSGNCAPVARVWDPDGLARQLDRLTGEFIGGCPVDAVAIVPGGWSSVDLTQVDLGDAAELLTPTAVAETTAVLEQIVADGGVVFARGVFGDAGETAEVTLSTFTGDFTYDDAPDVVAERLAVLGIATDGATVESRGGRDVLSIVSSDGATITERFVFPDAGLAVELAITSAADADSAELADAIADTVISC